MSLALIKAAARLILRERAHYKYADPALGLGVPDIYLTERELAREMGVSEQGKSGELVDAQRFLGALGIREFVSVDIPGSELAPELMHDLNTPLPAEMQNRFGLVIDPGTTEHVFDIRTALANVTGALKVGGVVIHFVPIYSYNGGYFSLNPELFHDFYAANGFEDLRSWILMWDRYRPVHGRTRCYPYSEVMRSRHALADHDQCRFTPHLLFIGRKAEARPEVVVPIQHHHYAPARPSRRSGRIARRLLPDGLVTYLLAMFRRERQLRRSRRQSFWV